MRPLAWVALLLAQAPAAQAAGLFQDKTVILLCQETVDAAGAPLCTLEAPLLDWLRGEGARTMDPAQTERIRRQMSPEKWTNPADLKGVDLLDADYAVVVVTRGSAQMNVGRMKSYLVQLAVRVVDVSRGHVVHAADFAGNGLGLNANAAMLQGATALWTQKSATLRGGLEAGLAAPLLQDVWAYDLEDLDSVTRAEELLRKAPGVTGVTRTAFTKGVACWRLTLQNGADVTALAKALEEGESPLAAQGLSGGVLQLAWRPLARVRLPMRVTVNNAAKVPPWFARAALDLATRQVRAVGWTRLVEGKGDPAVDVTVDVGPAGKGYAVKVTARAGKKPPLGAALEQGPQAALPELLQRALDKALQDVREALQRSPGEYADVARALTASAPLHAQLVLDSGTLRVLDADGWSTKGVGSVRLNQPVEEFTLRVRLGEGEWKALAVQRNTQEARVLLPVDLAPWRSLARATAANLEVDATARVGERLHRFALGRAVMVYPTRAMAWAEKDTFAAFINPLAGWARALALAVGTPETVAPTPVTARLAAIWDALQAQGLRYQPDPTSPFGSAELDLVNLPPETLGAGGGDCDDLTALVATAFEAAGQATLIIKQPRHVYLAVDSGLPSSAWPLFFPGPEHALHHQGRLYLPVEATAVGRTFWDAMRDAGERMAAQLESRVLVDPRFAWTSTPPLEQPGNPLAARVREQRVRVMVLGFSAAKGWESAARLAAREVANTLARNALLEVITEEQVTDMATLRRAQMLSGCDAAECTSDLGRALAVRAVVAGRLELLGEKVVLNITLQDVASKTVESAESVRIQAQTFDAETVAAPARAMLQTYLKRRVPNAPVASGYEERARQLERAAGKDPFAQARFLAFQGRTQDAHKAARDVRDPAKKALALGNVALVAGSLGDAQAAWQNTDAPAARINHALAQCSWTGGDACTQAARGLSPVDLKVTLGVDGGNATAGGDGAEAAVQALGRAVVDAAQGRAVQPVTGQDAALARRWMLQW